MIYGIKLPRHYFILLKLNFQDNEVIYKNTIMISGVTRGTVIKLLLLAQYFDWIHIAASVVE